MIGGRNLEGFRRCLQSIDRRLDELRLLLGALAEMMCTEMKAKQEKRKRKCRRKREEMTLEASERMESVMGGGDGTAGIGGDIGGKDFSSTPIGLEAVEISL